MRHRCQSPICKSSASISPTVATSVNLTAMCSEWPYCSLLVAGKCVGLSGPSVFYPPRIDPNYLDDDRDVCTLVAGLRIAREIGTAPTLDAWLGEELLPGPDVADGDSLRRYVRKSVLPLPPGGTCALGSTRASVVDGRLRVHGIAGLRIVDASVMPSIPSNNTAATVYAIAERAADLIIRPRKSRKPLTGGFCNHGVRRLSRNREPIRPEGT